jgi:hypothetical protein
MCRENFKNFDHIDCKIIAFEMKKELFLHHANFESFRLKNFALLKLEAFDVVLGN